MGGHPYWYIVPYREDVAAALEALRQRELSAGRYNPVTPFPEFPVPALAPPARRAHPSARAALAASGAEGTRSILDLTHISERPEMQAAAPVPPDDLEAILGTSRPSRAEIEAHLFDLLEDIDRGEGLYVVIYRDGEPEELLFAGYSFD